MPQGQINIEQSLRNALSLHAAGKLAEAGEIYRQILAASPTHYDGQRLLGVAAMQEGRLEESEQLIRGAIARDPKRAEGYHNLGDVLRRGKRNEEAIASYRKSIELQPNWVEAHAALGETLGEMGRVDQAEEAFRKVIELKPQFAAGHLALAKMLHAKGEQSAALAYVQRAVELDPKNAGGYFLLGHVLTQAGRKAEALETFRQGMRLDPNAHAWKFRVSALSGDGMTKTAPPDYVRGLFDEYAPNFEKQLVEKLNYRAPEQIFEAVKQATQRSGLDVLDAGCGTGLCGKLIRPMARRLVGVDLSPAMIIEATRSGIYDELINAEVIETMRATKDQYDLIMAGDVLIYIGDVSEFMPAAAGALRSGGMLACSIETYLQQGFILHTQERFAHSLGYMREMAAASGLKEISATPVALRRHGEIDVPGYIVVVGKT